MLDLSERLRLLANNKVLGVSRIVTVGLTICSMWFLACNNSFSVQFFSFESLTTVTDILSKSGSKIEDN